MRSATIPLSSPVELASVAVELVVAGVATPEAAAAATAAETGTYRQHWCWPPLNTAELAATTLVHPASSPSAVAEAAAAQMPLVKTAAALPSAEMTAAAAAPPPAEEAAAAPTPQPTGSGHRAVGRGAACHIMVSSGAPLLAPPP